MAHSRSRERKSDLMAGHYSADMSRRGSHQTSLPSFRDLLPPHLHEEIDANSAGIPPGTLGVNASSSDLDQASSAGSVTPSPSIPHPPMPSVAAGFDGFAGRYSESLSPRNIPRVQSPLHYHGPNNGMHKNPSSTPRYNPTAVKSEFITSSRTSPVLPPIRNIQALPDRSLHHSDRPFHSPMTSAHTGFSGSSSGGNDLGVNQFAHRRPALYDASQRGHHTYPLYQEISDRPTKDFMKLDSLGYEKSPRHSTYGDPYALDMEHSPRLMANPHQSGFNILDDVGGESRSKRRRGNLPKPVTDILKQWFHEHLDHPYPSEEDKQMFIARTGLSISQISNWFINARRRQLPALRNQIRSHDYERPTRHQSVSDTERVSSHSSSLSPS